jgi:toxin secretion/phage lysis holin
VDNWILAKGCLGLAVAIVSRFFASLPIMLQLMLIVMAFDLIFGSTRAGMRRGRHHWSWKRLEIGILKRIGAISVVFLAVVIQNHVTIKGFPQDALGTATAGFYVWQYGISFLDNLVGIGVPVPKFMRVVLERFNGDAKTEDGTAAESEATA